jgi:nucleotide-binding universal stress UspA family protein
MNEILVGLDFSESSMNALAHAVGLAKRFRSDLLCVWVENKNSIRHLNFDNGAELHDSVNEKFKKVMEEFKDEISLDKVELKLTKGVTYKEIIRVSVENKVDLIMVGAHGSQGFRRFLMGDNANHIIAEAKCPVISIREHRTLKKGLKTVVIPIDSTLDTRQKLPIATRIALAYGAEVHILGLYFTNVGTLRKRVNSYVEQTEKFLEKSGVKKVVTHYTKSNNGARTIMNYAVKVDAGMIATMIETERLASDVWLGSQGQQLVNQSPVPILSIANKEILRSRPGL